MSSKASETSATKKTAVACFTCRNKRQKCDGKTPSCAYCAEAGVPCSYPEVQKRRGPPPGYLKAIERRAKRLEAFLGYLLLEDQDLPFGRSVRSYLESGARDFLANHGDGDDEQWEPLCKAFHSGLSIFSTGGAAGLASNGSGARSPSLPSTAVPAKRARTASSVAKTERPESMTTLPPSGASDRGSAGNGMMENGRRPSSYDREMAALEAMQGPFGEIGGTSTAGSVGGKMATDSGQVGWPADSMWDAFAANDVFQPTARPPSRPQVTFQDFRRRSSAPQEMLDETDPPESSSTGMKRQAFEVNYTSSFWRSNDSRYPSPELGAGPVQSTSRVQLPPKDVQRHLMHVYLDVVHPLMPLLDEAELWRYMETPSDEGTPTLPRNLIFALCSYAACFSPNVGGIASSINTFGGDSAGGTLAEIWSEEVWTSLLTVDLRRRCSLDAVQTLCLVALRELGKGQDFQAWVMLGIAVRIAQDLELAGRTTESSKRTSANRHFRRRVWNCVCILDLLLSLQLGRQPAVRRHDFVDACSDAGDALPTSPLTGSQPQPVVSPNEAFDQNVRLCRIISQLQSRLYLNGKGTEADMNDLRLELEAWYQALPATCRVSLGHKIPVNTLCLHMTYYAAVVLLYRPFNLDEHAGRAMDAAAAFNVFLDTYHQQHAISKSQPFLVYLVFTVSISFFLITRRMRSTSTSFTASLSAQAALLKCLEALDGIAVTWPIAKRCHRVLERLIDGENFEALSSRPRKQEKDLSDPIALIASLPSGPSSGTSGNGMVTSMPASMPWNAASLNTVGDTSGLPTFDFFGASTGWGFDTLPEWDPSAGLNTGATPTDVQSLLASLLG